MNINILDYGAISDGKTLCTNEIQKAINDCSAAGGGRVTVPAGNFMAGTIWLKNHVDLHLEHGARLIASRDQKDYNALDAYEQNHDYLPEGWIGQHFILCVEQEDVAITGSGIIDGSGDAFIGEPFDYGVYNWIHWIAQARDEEHPRPGQLICFIESKNILVEDVTITNTPMWTLFLHGSEIISIRGIKIFNPNWCGNTDGVDIDACKYVTVSDCIILTGDDAFAIRCDVSMLKDKTKTCEYITITNCVLSTSASAIRFGVGEGAVRHVQVSNLTIREAGIMFSICSAYCGGGRVELEDIHIQNVSATAVCQPIVMEDMNNAGIHNITLENMQIESRYGCVFYTTTKGSVKDIVLRNVNMEIQKDESEFNDNTDAAIVECEGIHDLLFDNVKIEVADTARAWWKHDIRCKDCEDVEIYRCKYRQ